MKTPVPLTSLHFTKVQDEYIKQTKPDKLIKSQIESVHLNWIDAPFKDTIENVCYDGEESNRNDDLLLCSNNNTNSTLTIHRVICGDLTLSNKYIQMKLRVENCWKFQQDSQIIKQAEVINNSFKRQEMILSLSLSSIEFKTNPVIMSEYTTEEGSTYANSKSLVNKMNAKIINRLKNDVQIRHLLSCLSDDERKGILCCEASIQKEISHSNPTKIHDKSQSNNDNIDLVITDDNCTDENDQGDLTDLQERVFISTELLEGIRHIFFSHMESIIEVMEYFSHMPFLPRPNHFNNNRYDDFITDDRIPYSKKEHELVLSLANRLSLKLLEEVTCEACEKEDEEYMIDDLQIEEENDDNEKNHQQHDTFTKTSKSSSTGTKKLKK